MKEDIKENELLEVAGGHRFGDNKSEEKISVFCGQYKSKDECSKVDDCAWNNDECRKKGFGFEF